MKYDIDITENAKIDFKYYKKFEQRVIVSGIYEYLQIDINIETRKRKLLRPNPIAPWVLRIDKYRIFFQFQKYKVIILAVGHKEHNELYIRGRRIEL